MGFTGPPPDTLGGGAIEKPEEDREDERGLLDAPAHVAEHVRRTR